MKRTKKPVIDDKKLGVNPFLSNLKIAVNKVVIPGQYKVKDGALTLPVEVELERDASCRVYVDKERRLVVSGLTQRAKDLLWWLIYEVESGEDKIWINRVRYMEENEIKSNTTYIEARNDLIRAGILASTTIGSVYWINPYYFFNGSRIKSFPNNVILK